MLLDFNKSSLHTTQEACLAAIELMEKTLLSSKEKTQDAQGKMGCVQEAGLGGRGQEGYKMGKGMCPGRRALRSGKGWQGSRGRGCIFGWGDLPMCEAYILLPTALLNP